MTRRLHHAHTATSHDRGSDSFDRGQTGGIADVVVGLGSSNAGSSWFGAAATGRPVTAIDSAADGAAVFVPADRHPRERAIIMMSTSHRWLPHRRRPARHMCAESPKLALYALVLWRFEEVGHWLASATRAGVNVARWVHCKNANRAKRFRLLRICSIRARLQLTSYAPSDATTMTAPAIAGRGTRPPAQPPGQYVAFVAHPW